MSDDAGRLESLEAQVAKLRAQLEELQQLLQLVGDVQRFARLRQLLIANQLDAADRETARLLQLELRDGNGDLTPEAIERSPAVSLQIINALWCSHTAGRQGFTPQLERYRSLGGTLDTLIAQDASLFERFMALVAWPLLPGAGLTLMEPCCVPAPAALNPEGQICIGHLPVRCWATDYGLKAANLLMARLTQALGDG